MLAGQQHSHISLRNARRHASAVATPWSRRRRGSGHRAASIRGSAWPGRAGKTTATCGTSLFEGQNRTRSREWCAQATAPQGVLGKRSYGLGIPGQVRRLRSGIGSSRDGRDGPGDSPEILCNRTNPRRPVNRCSMRGEHFLEGAGVKSWTQFARAAASANSQALESCAMWSGWGAAIAQELAEGM